MIVASGRWYLLHSWRFMLFEFFSIASYQRLKSVMPPVESPSFLQQCAYQIKIHPQSLLP